MAGDPKTYGGALQGAINSDPYVPNRPEQGGTTPPFFDNPDPIPGTYNTPATPPSYNTPYQPPSGATKPTWMDMTQPGAAEQFYSKNSAWFTQPTNSQAAYDQNSPLFQQMSQQGGPTYSQDAYKQFGSTPADAGLGGYYDNAWKNTSEQLNRELAARGEFNSGAALETLGRASANMGAERANREADYRLRRSQLGGDLASRASGESLSGRESQLSAARSGSALAGDADSAALNKMGLGLGASNIAQSSREGRVRGAFNDVSQLTQDQVNTLLPAMERNLSEHAELQGMPFEIQMNYEQAKQAGDQAQAENILKMAAAVYGGQK